MILRSIAREKTRFKTFELLNFCNFFFCNLEATKFWATIKSQIWNVQHEVCVVQSIDSIKNSDDNIETEHLNTFRTIWQLIDVLANIVGVNTNEEVQINARIIFTTLLICFAFLSLFYTMVVVWPSIPTLLEAICIFGVLVPVYRYNVKFARNKNRIKISGHNEIQISREKNEERCFDEKIF